MTKDQMLEELMLKYKLTVSEYDRFYNRYSKMKLESIRKIYEKVKAGKFKNREAFEIGIEKIFKDEKRRLSINHKITSRWL